MEPMVFLMASGSQEAVYPMGKVIKKLLVLERAKAINHWFVIPLRPLYIYQHVADLDVEQAQENLATGHPVRWI
jgi:hypothetical protein